MKLHRIEELRLAKKMSRKKLAELTKLHESTIYRVEKNLRASSIDIIIRICDALECDLNYLLEENSNKE